ncbi:MAG: prepilin-type N-terminal cleavage/methylation domain-containing protein [Bdellovibrionales bacterium]|nr:prepilin-type N-terminal cleavage/methylation domain-containing protein [Bdellovibrionales bacterium]
MDRMRISLSKRSKHPRQNDGFSLIEVLVALFLLSMIFGLVSMDNNNFRREMNKVVNNLESAIRFAVDEAALKNSIVRIHFYLDRSPQEYRVEVGPDSSFLLPSDISPPPHNSSLAAHDEFKQKQEILNKQFNPVREFQEQAHQLPDDIQIVAVGNGSDDTMINDIQTSIYIYPTGEKDAAIIILGSEEELISLSIDPFTMNLERKYLPLSTEGTTQSLPEIQLDQATSIFTQWLQEGV